MQKLVTILASILIFICFSAQSSALIEEEVELREFSQSMYDRLINSVSFPITFNNRSEFEQIAKNQGYSSSEFEHLLQLIARLDMEPNIKSAANSPDAKSIISLLERIPQSMNEFTMLAILKGRNRGRIDQEYKQAIEFYNEALTRINDSYDIEALLLKYTIYEHLGGLHLLLRQDVAALMNFQNHRDIAYKLRNDYLIASAEAKLGHYYSKNKQLTKSLQHYSEAIRLSNRANYPSMKTHLQLQLAKVYRDLKQWDDALSNAHEAAEGFKKLGNDTYLSSCMTVIAMVYGELNEWNRAIDFYLNAQQLDAKSGNYIAQGLNFHNLGQAYFNIKDNQSALKYLLMANEIFTEKQSKHYLVYNELLISEIGESNYNWPLMMEHADKALLLAQKLALPSEQKTALTYIATAAQHMQNLEKTISTQAEIIALEQQTQLAQTPETQNSLAEQQLKLELNMLQGKLTDTLVANRDRVTWLAIFIFISLLLSATLVWLFFQRKNLQQKNQQLEQLSQKSPFVKQLGYGALLNDLSTNTSKESSLVLLAFSAHLQTDLEYGQYFSNTCTQFFASMLTHAFGQPTYVIRQGVFAVRLTEPMEPSNIVKQVQQTLAQHNSAQQFTLGQINLPLLTKSDVNIAPKLLFEAAQMALACARSLDMTQNHYVLLKALDFVPPSLFSNPLFLQLEKGIERGLIRLETSGNKEQIQWPCWENNQHKHLLENI